ncbi:tachylectin-related carbohydrate-binding protein [Deinococcus hopiensis]|uniref:Tachylectin n=1 Tax=Deinococcus hopiensis KR-140 TaxID=695939 RepID=A0A1W1UE60_9DEIO|nr:tachylectin-related carbohydrate-binding protein [Deinococcus hopiensis]SMB79322.1 Tachylectin [Deinococcus hopiensis KR-140]
MKGYRHNAALTGGGLYDAGAWVPRGGEEIGVGWNIFTRVFAAPGGVIYGVMPNGNLKWYWHLAYRTGGGLYEAGAWDPRGGKVVGTGWNGFTQLAAGKNRVIAVHRTRVPLNLAARGVENTFCILHSVS